MITTNDNVSNRKLINEIKLLKKAKLIRVLAYTGIAICIAIVIILGIIFVPKLINAISNNSNSIIVKSNVSKNKDISEDAARELAVKQFQKLNETIKKEELEVISLNRYNEAYYYIVGKDNTMEIKIKGGEITRINGTLVEDLKINK